MEKRDASFCRLPSGRETIFTPGTEARGSDSEDPDSPPEVHQEEMCSFLFHSYGGSQIQNEVQKRMETLTLKESQLTCGNPEVHTFSSHFLKPADQTGREETAQLDFPLQTSSR